MLKAQNKSYTDVELVDGCTNGSELHFRLLYERYYGRMLNVCKRYAKDNDESRDMIQEGFIRAFKSIGQYRKEGSFEGWLRRVIVTSCINYYRKYNKSATVEFTDQTRTDNPNSEFNAAIETAPALTKYDAEFLLKQIQNLPPTYRMAFNLYAIEGYSHREIAEKLNITENTSRSNLTKARQKLKQLIELTEKVNSIYHG